MTAHLVSSILLLAVPTLLYGWMRTAQRSGRLRVPTPGLWATLAISYLIAIAQYLHTMEGAKWSDGLVVFIALCAALPCVNLIRRVCPTCQRRLTIDEVVVVQPRRTCHGVGAVMWSCPHCGHHRVQTHTIPSRAETSAEAVSWRPETHTPPAGFGGSHGSGASGSAAWLSGKGGQSP